MKCLDYELEYKVVERLNKSTYPVIIVAAGSSSRMCGIDKMRTIINGLTVIERTVSAFENSADISNIIIVTRADLIEEFSVLLSKYSKISAICEGGTCREESVLRGIKCIDSNIDKVLVHDGARPFVSGEVIGRVCEALGSFNSVTCAVKVKDTVKSVNEDSIVIKTLQRDFLMSVQTPQGVSVKKFLESAANYSLSRFTDDTSVVEAVGCSTKIVEGDYKNIKITTPDDVALAQFFTNKEN